MLCTNIKQQIFLLVKNLTQTTNYVILMHTKKEKEVIKMANNEQGNEKKFYNMFGVLTHISEISAFITTYGPEFSSSFKDEIEYIEMLINCYLKTKDTTIIEEIYQEYEEGKKQYLKEKDLYLLLSDAIIAAGKSNNNKNL